VSGWVAPRQRLAGYGRCHTTKHLYRYRVVYPTEGCQFGGRYVIKGTSRVRYETLWNVIYVISAVFEVLAVCIFKAVQDEKNAYSMLSPNRR
jgi:thiamine transporter ThiT